MTTRLDDLVAALRAGEIAGAALDVFEQEPLPAGHPLWTTPNVLITPHTAGYGPYLDDRRYAILLDNCRRFLASRPLRNVTDTGSHCTRRSAMIGAVRPKEAAMETTYSLDQFLADTRATIKAKGIPAGLAEIRDHLEKLLHNPDLLKKHLGDPVPHLERTTIGHDPETDVHVLVHGRAKGAKSSVHDHGSCWVVYGNYQNATRMRRWRRLDDGGRPGYAELTLQREFLNEPGHAAAFAVGDIHSIEFGDDTFFIRVTGGDVETKETHRFDVEKKTVEIANRAQGQR